jgi:hypothetical protein
MALLYSSTIRNKNIALLPILKYFAAVKTSRKQLWEGGINWDCERIGSSQSMQTFDLRVSKKENKLQNALMK